MTSRHCLQKIVSGGQTGVDRAGLDVAIELGLEHGGWCPLGRLAEDGFIPTKYALRQLESQSYAARTERNVVDSDATLIIARGELSGGTELTRQFCNRHGKPLLVVNLHAPASTNEVHEWLLIHHVVCLNVAGPRESTSPGIQAAAYEWLRVVLRGDDFRQERNEMPLESIS